MSKHLRLDMYINSTEILIGEAPATVEGFEEILSMSAIIDGRIAEEIRTLGVSDITSDFRSEDVLDLLWDITGIDVQERDEINFCMCIWDGDEHLKSAVSIEKIGE